ncbi:hypothetical protein BIW11_13456 [Tropilaelaps mercedesae]|uniref:Uncharacterized protein n=1 Tax=Tropilaelaps mercedesae TaxID=418985 RepID=A0A1V9X234_9ACAR|nr:hypothetical protein BIW11_13456 [Tropilaelaps mercedesae]
MPKHKIPYRRDVPSKIGSLSNLSHKPKESQVKIFSKRVDFRSGAQSRVAEVIRRGSLASGIVADPRDGIIDKIIDGFCSTVNLQNSWTDGAEHQGPGTSLCESTSGQSKEGYGQIEGVRSSAVDMRMDGRRVEGDNPEGDDCWSVDRVEELLTPKEQGLSDGGAYGPTEKDEAEENSQAEGLAPGDSGNLEGSTDLRASFEEDSSVAPDEVNRTLSDRSTSDTSKKPKALFSSTVVQSRWRF